MGAILGEGDFRYEHILDWHKLPEECQTDRDSGRRC